MKTDRDKYMTLEDLRKFFLYLRKRKLFWYYFFKTQLVLGARIGEVILLRVKDIDLEESVMNLPTLKRKFKKGVTEVIENYLCEERIVQRIRVVFQDKELFKFFKKVKEKFKENNILLFPVSKRVAQNSFKKFVKDSGLDRNYSSHALRHSFGILTYKTSGGDLLSTSRRLRHKKVSTSEIYVHLDEEKERKLAKELASKLMGV